MVAATSPMPMRVPIRAAIRATMAPAGEGEVHRIVSREISGQVAAPPLIALPIVVDLQRVHPITGAHEVHHPARAGAVRREGHQCLALEHLLRRLHVRAFSLAKACAPPLRLHEFRLRLPVVWKSRDNPVAARCGRCQPVRQLHEAPGVSLHHPPEGAGEDVEVVAAVVAEAGVGSVAGDRPGFDLRGLGLENPELGTAGN